MGVLRDSVDPFAIPLDGLDGVAGYGDGIYQWTSDGWARFQPPIVPLSIVVVPGDVGDVADVERGDFQPADAKRWFLDFARPGRRAPTYYVNRTNWPAVVDALALNVAAACDWWISTLDGTTDVWYGSPGVEPPAELRVVAVQARGSAQTGANYDESVILDPFWLAGTWPPAPPPAPWPADTWGSGEQSLVSWPPQ